MPVKALKELLAPFGHRTTSDLGEQEVRGLAFDSRKVEPGFLFVAIRGFQSDGHDFVDQAEKKGALAALVEAPVGRCGLPQFRIGDGRAALAEAARIFYGDILDGMCISGITGTNGKTSTAFLLRSILEAAGRPAGMIGTVLYRIGDESIPAWNTTPESVDICMMIEKMRHSGQYDVVMEVSSHALELKRVDCLRFDSTVFTNLSHDHLDFHKDEEHYFAAKKRLFGLLSEKGSAAVNADDSYGQHLLKELGNRAVSFGLKVPAQVRAQEWENSLQGVHLKLRIGNALLDIQSRLIGTFNVENITAAATAAFILGITPEAIREGIEAAERIPGRLEPFRLKNGVTAVVDYAHTPDALTKALRTLAELKQNKLWVVFGCGGDRDKTKRPVMGSIAVALADEVVVTSDNPRFEDPQRIINDIVGGIKEKESVKIEEDRMKAINHALSAAGSGDIVLVAGKGHETYQDIAGVKHHFDDREIIEGWN